jgi:AcrR family transcriptional regulator
MKARQIAQKEGGKPRVNRSSRFRAGGARVEGAREKILRGARQVFSLHAFRAATTRMIAQAAGVEHPLIHYHFGSKEMLFEAVTEQMCDEFARAHLACFEDVRHLPPGEGFSLYLDRLLDYCLENPEPLQLIYLNMVHIGRLEEIPGYRFISLHLEGIRQTLRDRINLQAPRAEVDRLIHCFQSMMISFIGAKSCQAQSLGLAPESAAYKKWIKESLMLIFLPMLEALIFPPKAGEPASPEHSPRKPNGRES